MGFQLVPKLATLNDLERHNGLYFALFLLISQNSVSFVANYVKVVD